MGRSVFKIANSRSDIEIVAIRTEKTPEECAYLAKHDSIYGSYAKAVNVRQDAVIVGDNNVTIVNEKSTTKLPWRKLNVDVVIDVSHHTDAAELRRHKTAGAKRVISLSRCSDFPTVVAGVNDEIVGVKTDIVCRGSAVTSSIAPILAALDEEIGIDAVTVSSVSDAQHISHSLQVNRLDESDLIAVSGEYGDAIRAVLPDADFTIDGIAIHSDDKRSKVGLSTLNILAKDDTTAGDINAILTHASHTPMFSGILSVTDNKLVAEDFRGNSYSSIVDAAMTSVVGGKLVQVSAWYDCEWSSANRLVELAVDSGRFARNTR